MPSERCPLRSTGALLGHVLYLAMYTPADPGRPGPRLDSDAATHLNEHQVPASSLCLACP